MKYIDTEKLKKEVEKRRKFHDNAIISFCNSQTIRLTHSAGLKEDEEILSLIDSLEQDEPEASKSKFTFPSVLYARTIDNKTIDVSYTPQSLDAVEYIKNDQTEQPDADLKSELAKWMKYGPHKSYPWCTLPDIIKITAAHFYELGLKARKEE